jgi:phosphoribosylanthranilate isomerase
MTSYPAVKICGLTRPEDASAAAEAGADFLGVVLVPGTPRAVTPGQAREVVEGLGVPPVVVMADEPPGEAERMAEMVGARIIQLHGDELPEYASGLAERGPWKIWKALRVKDIEDVFRGIGTYGGIVDGLLLDGWHPRHRGGSGVPFDWREVEGIRDSFPEGLRFIAAGGLRPENVEEAVRRLAPHVLDVSSGVEVRPGVKSRNKIHAFIRNARRPGRGDGS